METEKFELDLGAGGGVDDSVDQRIDDASSSASSVQDHARHKRGVDFPGEDKIHYIETEAPPVSAETQSNVMSALARAATSPVHTPRDLKMLERFGGRVHTALEARSIVMRRRKSNLGSVDWKHRLSAMEPDEAYNEIATGVVVNEQEELLELIDEIEMLEGMIIDIEAHKNRPATEPQRGEDSGWSRIIERTLKQNPDGMINRLHKRLTLMKANAVNKAMQLNLMHPDSPRAPLSNDVEGEGGFAADSSVAGTEKAPSKRLQSGKEYIRSAYPDITYKPKTKLFWNSPSQIGSPGALPASPRSIDSRASSRGSPKHLELEVERRLRSSLRFAEKRAAQDSSLPPPLPGRGPRRGWRVPPSNTNRHSASVPAGTRITPTTLSTPPSLEERRRNCAGFFDMRFINSKDANSWLARDRQSGEINWISGLRQYEPLNV
eukprot:Gregarina_sp_Poly_1__4199@NODE_2298_length_2337_cov_30_299559_g1472_i0_p1_GENE_NODE_2298_length_2337_cov_30_299559_g1472_i0NODE_2298_length_2337_cov_30_299559_g1472_i0_p1_ORF_typecomplete_len435_score66_86_NODE_2298_length_2337_cov_30_299559_g1472_i04921796